MIGGALGGPVALSIGCEVGGAQRFTLGVVAMFAIAGVIGGVILDRRRGPVHKTTMNLVGFAIAGLMVGAFPLGFRATLARMMAPITRHLLNGPKECAFAQ